MGSANPALWTLTHHALKSGNPSILKNHETLCVKGWITLTTYNLFRFWMNSQVVLKKLTYFKSFTTKYTHSRHSHTMQSLFMTCKSILFIILIITQITLDHVSPVCVFSGDCTRKCKFKLQTSLPESKSLQCYHVRKRYEYQMYLWLHTSSYIFGNKI